MEKQGDIRCPGCGAPNKYPGKTVIATEFNYPRHRPVIFTCGTVTSRDWAPPLWGENCNNNRKDWIMETCYVYAVCNGGHGLYLSVEFEGTRAECNAYIKQKVRNNRPTHFNHVSALPFDRATRKFID